MGLTTTLFTGNPLLLPASIAAANRELKQASPTTIIEWAAHRAERPVISTNFRPGAAALLYLVTRRLPNISVVWVDTGYNTPATYRYVDRITARLGLNLKIYSPRTTVARRAALGGVPAADASDFAQFARETKIEPFERAFHDLRPDIWFTGIRAEQSSYRRSLDIVSRGANHSLRVAPIFNWSQADVDAYLEAHGIEDNSDYVDPTKPAPHLECGVQLLAR